MFAELAQAAEATPALYTYGPLGAITCWLMYRDERRAIQVRETERVHMELQMDVMHRIDGLTKALLVKMLKDEPEGSATHEYAATAIAKIDTRAAREGMVTRPRN